MKFTWMCGKCSFLVSFLDLVVVCTPLDPEYLVVVFPLGLLQPDLGLVEVLPDLAVGPVHPVRGLVVVDCLLELLEVQVRLGSSEQGLQVLGVQVQGTAAVLY